MRSPRVIQTRYGGVRYRSRVEARWALFFDLVGLRAEYEPEGFELPTGAYLVDFWLPGVNLYFEVKSTEPDDEEVAKCAQLTEATGVEVLLAVGAPDERFLLHWFDRGGLRVDRYVLAQDKDQRRGFWLVAEDHANWIGPPGSAGLPLGPMFSGLLEDAYAMARAERFEGAVRDRRHQALPLDSERFAA